MSNQLETYMILKPISERVNRISASITDDEIKSLIKSVIREQFSRVNFTAAIDGLCESWTEDNESAITGMLMESLKNKFR
jgi:hypothetical protein